MLYLYRTVLPILTTYESVDLSHVDLRYRNSDWREATLKEETSIHHECAKSSDLWFVASHFVTYP